MTIPLVRGAVHTPTVWDISVALRFSFSRGQDKVRRRLFYAPMADVSENRSAGGTIPCSYGARAVLAANHC